MPSTWLLQRIPHPVASLDDALENRRAVCEPRGFCGPFLNEDFYASLAEPLWSGMAECLHCCSTVHVATELAKRDRALRRPDTPRAKTGIPRRPDALL